MFNEKAFENFYKALPKSGESWLCIFIVMFVLIISISLLGFIKTDENKEAMSEEQKKRKKLVNFAGGAAGILAVALIIGLVAVFSPKPVATLCAEGNYKAAYETATEKNQLAVFAEEAAAKQSVQIADKLEDAKSFKLLNAYYCEISADDRRLVLQISGTNKLGKDIESYRVYNWDADKNDWVYYCNISDIEGADDELANKIGLIAIREAIADDNMLSEDAVARINKLFKNGNIEKASFIDYKKLDKES